MIHLCSIFHKDGYWRITSTYYGFDYGGSGGASGAGGNVYYYDLSKVHAYNGDMITNEDYTTKHYAYDIEGNLTTTALTTVTKQNGDMIIPAIIFAQTGTIRATYQTNQHMSQAECNKYGVEYYVYGDQTTLINVEITKETKTATTRYGQGIGSGAGNLEKSNGILASISAL